MASESLCSVNLSLAFSRPLSILFQQVARIVVRFVLPTVHMLGDVSECPTIE